MGWKKGRFCFSWILKVNFIFNLHLSKIDQCFFSNDSVILQEREVSAPSCSGINVREEQEEEVHTNLYQLKRFFQFSTDRFCQEFMKHCGGASVTSRVIIRRAALDRRFV